MKILITLFLVVSLGAQAQNLKPLEVSLISLNAIDFATTQYGLSKGALEANPIMRMKPYQMGLVKASATGLSIFLSRKLLTTKEQKIFLWVANVFYSGVVANNVRVVIKIR